MEGGKEAEEGKVAVRKQGKGDKGAMLQQDFVDFINEEVENMLSEIEK